ncbi:MAG: ATP-binding protein [Bacteroidetes bacterium]|nr:MAG: ATP-binding protein [Bacteroidota bacterium]
MTNNKDCRSISFSRKLSSDRKSLRNVEPMLKEIKEMFSLNEELYYNLVITVTEAVNNAIIHGNKFDEKKFVNIHVECNGKLLIVTVKDEGSGFDLGKLESPLLPENLLKESGRGIFIIRKISDKVEFKFTDEGTELILYFKLNE